jgi:hypothetical protein
MRGIGSKLAALESTIEKVIKEKEDHKEMIGLKAMIAMDTCVNESECRENLKLLSQLDPSPEVSLNQIAILITLGDLESAYLELQSIDKSSISSQATVGVLEYSCALVQELQGDIEIARNLYIQIVDRTK